MKTKITQILVLILLVGSSFTLSAATSSRSFDDYTITEISQSNLTPGIDRAWALNYEPNSSPISILFKKGRYCKTYIVRGDHFEIVYECTRNGFGARLVKDSESLFPSELTDAVVNSDELARQRILTPGPVDDERALSLIAAFLPDLINPGYLHLLE